MKKSAPAFLVAALVPYLEQSDYSFLDLLWGCIFWEIFFDLIAFEDDLLLLWFRFAENRVDR